MVRQRVNMLYSDGVQHLISQAGQYIEEQTASSPFPPRLRKSGAEWDMQNVIEISVLHLAHTGADIDPMIWYAMLAKYVAANETDDAQRRVFHIQSEQTLAATERIAEYIEQRQADAAEAALTGHYNLRKRAGAINLKLIIHIALLYVASRHDADLHADLNNAAAGYKAARNRAAEQDDPRSGHYTASVRKNIVAIWNSTPPSNQRRWTYQQIADKAVADGVIDRISKESVRLIIKEAAS